MGSPIAGMLLGQAAPSGIADSSLSNLSPEAQALIKQLAQQGQIPPTPEPTPAPAPQPAQGGGILEMLKGAFNRFLPSTASLAPQAQPTPQALTPEQLAERNRILAGGR